MNNTTIKEPNPKASREPREGDLFRRLGDDSNDVYVLHHCGGEWVAVNIVTGRCCRPSPTLYPEKAVLGLRRLPPGTVITITVE